MVLISVLICALLPEEVGARSGRAVSEDQNQTLGSAREGEKLSQSDIKTKITVSLVKTRSIPGGFSGAAS